MFGGLDLKGTTAKSEPPKEEDPPKEAASAFSFLANSSAPASQPTASSFSFLNSGAENDEAGEKKPSAFGFMAPSSTETKPEEVPPPPPPPAAAAVGAFDFLQQPAAQRETPPPPQAASSSPVVSDDLLSVANVSNQPTGAGLVFATTAKRKTVKKRSRTAKIGAGTAPVAPGRPPPSAMPPTASVSRSVSEDSTKLADAAAEASRRAEEFIHRKFQQAESAAAPALETVKSEDDDVIIAAKAAAAEAKQLQQQQKKSSSFSNLFRGRSPTPKPVTNSNSTPATNSVDRLQQEQKEAKRAMAERQLQMQNDTTAPQKESTPPSSSFQLPTTTPAVSTFAPLASSTVNSAVPTVKTTGPTKPSQSSFGLPDVLSTPQTPTDKFNKILQDFETQVSANMDQLTRLHSQKRSFLEEHNLVTARMQLAQSEAENCQKQQSAAAEAEDFDTAAQLAEMIQEYEQEQAACKGTLGTIDTTIVEIDKQVDTTVKTIEALFQGLQPKLDKFSETQSEDSDAVATIEKFSLISKQLSAEHDRLQNDFKHLERDSELVREERNELEKAISEQSGEYEKLRDQARSKLQETEAAIEALRKELDQKQREAAQLRTEAAGHDESVLRVRVKFARQITRVQTKEMTIQDHKEDWESEKRAYDQQKQAHDAQVQAHSEALVAKDKLANSLKKQIADSETYGSMIAEVIQSHVSENIGSADATLQAEVVQHQADVRKCQVALDSAKAAVSSLEREIEFLINDIPVFEETKKAAAARRDFKSASKASKDIKEATARLSAAQSELQGEATDRLKATEAELKAAKEKLDQAQAIALAQEKESVVGIMAEWADTLKRLSATVKNLEDGVGVPAATKYCLKAQMKALRAQGEAYGEKYGGWKELMADFEDSLDEGTSDNHQSSEVTPVQAGTPSVAADVEEPVSTEPNSDERMRQFLLATTRLKDVEQELEDAAAAEDYEKAAELDEELQELLALVEKLNLTDSEMEQALAMDLASSSQDNQMESPSDLQKDATIPSNASGEEAEAGVAPSVCISSESGRADNINDVASSEDPPRNDNQDEDIVHCSVDDEKEVSKVENFDDEDVKHESNGGIEKADNKTSEACSVDEDVPEQEETTSNGVS